MDSHQRRLAPRAHLNGLLSTAPRLRGAVSPRATPTRVANTMTVNPLAAALLATVLVSEPITLNLIIGRIAVFAGIWIATTVPRPRAEPGQ